MFNSGSLRLLLMGLFILGSSSLLLAQRDIPKKNKKAKAEKSAEEKRRQGEYFFTEGEKYFILEDYTKAVAAYQLSLGQDPGNDVVFFKLAEIYLATNQNDLAQSSIDQALEINKNNKYYYLLAIDIYTTTTDLTKVAGFYQDLINNFPNGDQYLISLAAVYLYQNKPQEALAVYNQIEEKFGVNEQSTFQKQKIYLQLNDVDMAIAEGEKLISAYPEGHRYTILLCEILASNGQEALAVQRLENLLAGYPDYAEARLVLGDIYWKQRKTEGFSTQMILAFEATDLIVNAKINAIMKYMAYIPNEQLEPIVLELTDILIEVHADDPNAFLLSGDIYATYLEKALIEEADIPEIRQKAIDSYDTYLVNDPSKFAVWQNLLNLELQSEDQTKLAAHADTALELFPNQAWLYLVNGVVRLQEDDPGNAAQMFEMGKKRSANNMGLAILFNSYLGDTYNTLNEYTKSDEAYEAALEMDPNNYLVLNNYSYYLSLRGENLDEAKSMSTKLIRNNPDNNTYLDTYAWVNYALGDYDEAKRVLEKIIASEEPNAEYYNHYGDVLYQLGDRDEAVLQWKKAKELDKELEYIDQKIKERKVIQ